MMQIITRILVTLAALLEIIHGSKQHLKQTLNDMIENGGDIDGLFKPLQYINDGGVGVVYKGIRIADRKLMALKFVDGDQKNHREFTMYTYLKAIDQPGKRNVERFGIPTVYYYKKWKRYILMALSYLNGGDLLTEVEAGHFKNPLDSLILFRDFVIQSKYIHSCGIRHDDIKPENILIDSSGRSFLIDFDVSCKMNEFGNGTTLEYASRQWHIGQIRDAKSDWESFLYTMCYINFVKLDWLFGINLSEYSLSVASAKCAKWKNNTNKTITRICSLKSRPLNEVFLAFATEVFYKDDNTFPNYDELYKLICDKIEAMGKDPESAHFTWTSASDGIPLPDIEKEITSPNSIVQRFEHFTYPKVDLNHFVKKKK